MKKMLVHMIVWSGVVDGWFENPSLGKGEARWVEVWLAQCIVWHKDFIDFISFFLSTLDDVSGVHHMCSFHFISFHHFDSVQKKANK
jgi:hypothetical protein